MKRADALHSNQNKQKKWPSAQYLVGVEEKNPQL